MGKLCGHHFFHNLEIIWELCLIIMRGFLQTVHDLIAGKIIVWGYHIVYFVKEIATYNFDDGGGKWMLLP